MANDPVSPRPLPFNIPSGIDALKARDARFWPAYQAWHEAEAVYELYPGFEDEDPHAGVLLDRATQLFDDMISIGVRTGAALSMKFEALTQAGWGMLDMELPCGFSVAEVLKFDAERIAKFEMFGPDAFQDMAEG